MSYLPKDFESIILKLHIIFLAYYPSVVYFVNTYPLDYDFSNGLKDV